MKRGDLKPDLEVIIGDDDAEADFSTLTAGACAIVVEQDNDVIVDDAADSIAVAPGNKTAILKRAWETGETDRDGRHWVQVRVTWPDGDIQYFPEDGALRLDIERAPGDP